MASPATRSPVLRWLPVGLLALLAVALGLVLGLGRWWDTDLSQSGPAPSPSPAVAQIPPAASTAAPTPAPPRFDVVRVAPDGSVVIAGRAAPGAEVTVREGTTELGRARADDQGAFVLVPAVPLPPGVGELTLSARPPGGGAEQAGASSVVLAVPPREAGAPTQAAAAPPLAVLLGPGAPRALQGPGMAQPGHLGMGALDYDQHGKAQFAGTAPPGSRVRVYVDNHPAGEALTGSDGRWSLSPATPLAPGRHRMRLDQIGPGGKVVARIELPFLREDLAGRDLRPGSVMVQPGENLWRIARATYGTGMRYVVDLPGQPRADPQPEPDLPRPSVRHAGPRHIRHA